MTGKVSKRPVGRPPKSGSPYAQLSRAMATVFDSAVQKIGGPDEIANLLVTEMRDNGKVLDVLKVVQTYLPRQHNVDLGLSASDSLSDALRGVADKLSQDKAERAKQADIIEGDFTESD